MWFVRNMESLHAINIYVLYCCKNADTRNSNSGKLGHFYAQVRKLFYPLTLSCVIKYKKLTFFILLLSQ